jgi:hypothetical protein
MPDQAAPRTTTRRGRKPQRTHYEEFCAAIGRFVLIWAHLETSLDLLLLKIVKTPERRAKLPHQLREKIALIRSEIKKLTHDQQIAITEVLDEISSYADSRHDFVHSGNSCHSPDGWDKETPTSPALTGLGLVQYICSAPPR